MFSKNWCSENFCRPQACTFSKTDAGTGVFPVNVAKFLRPPFLQKTAFENFPKISHEARESCESKTDSGISQKSSHCRQKTPPKNFFFWLLARI